MVSRIWSVRKVCRRYIFGDFPLAGAATLPARLEFQGRKHLLGELLLIVMGMAGIGRMIAVLCLQ